MTKTHIPKTTRVWQPVNLYGCEIGENCSIGCFTEIQEGVKIGNYSRIGAGCFIPEGVEIEEYVFVGPHTCFTNDRAPSANKCLDKDFIPGETLVKKGATIGANCTILSGIVIGEHSFVGAGSVVTKDIPEFEMWTGNPARKIK